MGRLSNGDWLLAGNSIFSDDNGTEFRMQDDGKVAVYHGEDDNSGTGHAIWHTDTAGGKGNQSTTLVVQDDGNVVLYNEGGDPIWHTASNK
ncbi:hypothetical protein SNK04_013467 [Fusarium graminearum]